MKTYWLELTYENIEDSSAGNIHVFFYVEYMYVVLLRGMQYEQFESAQTNQNPSANMR
jgi:hypothetical protein